MIPNLTPTQSDRLKQLLDSLEITGGNGLMVTRLAWARFAISDARPVPNAVSNGGGAGEFRLCKLTLDPTTATLTGSPTTQCGFKYFIYPPDETTFDTSHRLPDGATSPSRLDYRGHMAICQYVPAPAQSFGQYFIDPTVVNTLRVIALKEQPLAEAC